MRMTTELHISAVLNRQVINPAGKVIGKLWDVAVAPGEALPVVTALLLKCGHRIVSVPWRQVVLFNPRVISVTGAIDDLPSYETEPQAILVRRDVLDKQIVDVNGAKVVRVNDIKLFWLQAGDRRYMVPVAVDIGLRGLARRLGVEFLFKKRENHFVWWQFIRHLEEKTASLQLTGERSQLDQLHPADLAEIIEDLDYKKRADFIEDLDVEVAAEAFAEMELDTQI